jgi:signal transduction histidine kinase
MNGIIGLTDVLQAELKDEEVLDKLAMIKRSGENLLLVIDQLLLAAQARSGHLDLNLCHFSLGKLVHKCVDLHRPLAQSKGIELAIVIESQGGDIVYSSPSLVEQILSNLLGNAVKFSHRGKIAIKASVYTAEKKFFVEVADEGPGIPRDHQARIFQPFEQLDGSLSRQYQGTGLGLSICLDLLQILFGSIRLESQLGKGSTFFVEIPFARDVQKASPQEVQPSRAAAASKAWSASV